MSTTNARKHVIPRGGDVSISRATIFETFGNSIRDIVPVANTTDRDQVVSNLDDAGETVAATAPLIILRADASGLHRVEYSTDGSVFLPASGVLAFADTSARDTWTISNSGLLRVGDVCYADNKRYEWLGSEWNDWKTVSSFSNSFSSASAPDTVRYRKIAGVVHLAGVTSRGTTPTSLTTAFTLPAGFRPASTVRLRVRRDVDSELAVLSTGAVQISWQTGTGSLGSLNGISFVAEG